MIEYAPASIEEADCLDLDGFHDVDEFEGCKVVGPRMRWEGYLVRPGDCAACPRPAAERDYLCATCGRLRASDPRRQRDQMRQWQLEPKGRWISYFYGGSKDAWRPVFVRYRLTWVK